MRRGILFKIAIGFSFVIVLIVIIAFIIMGKEEHKEVAEEKPFIYIEQDKKFQEEVAEDDEYLRDLEIRHHKYVYETEDYYETEADVSFVGRYANRDEDGTQEIVDSGVIKQEDANRLANIKRLERLSDLSLEDEHKIEELTEVIANKYLDEFKNNTLDLGGRSFKRIYVDWDGNEIEVDEAAMYPELAYNEKLDLNEYLRDLVINKNCAFYIDMGLTYFSMSDSDYGYDEDYDSEILGTVTYTFPFGTALIMSHQEIKEIKDGCKVYSKNTIEHAKKLADSVKDLVDNGDTRVEFYGDSEGNLVEDGSSAYKQFRVAVLKELEETENFSQSITHSAVAEEGGEIFVFDITNENVTGYVHIYRLPLKISEE